MKKPTAVGQNIQKRDLAQMEYKKAPYCSTKALSITDEWLSFNHENPGLKPGLYWAVGLKPSEVHEGVAPFYIQIEIFSNDKLVSVLPSGTVPFYIFYKCLPYIEWVQPVIFPLNPYTQSVIDYEYA